MISHGSRQRCFFDGSQNDMGDPEEQMLKAKRCEKDEKLAKLIEMEMPASSFRVGPNVLGIPIPSPFLSDICSKKYFRVSFHKDPPDRRVFTRNATAKPTSSLLPSGPPPPVRCKLRGD
ncbi:hypothetical protein BHE74_00021027 [Ensete ventricosum]|nr:hypothetical protein BHE74_00021027 [Ensete ventricosum]